MAFVRVKDKETGHEFDVPDSDWRIKEQLFVPVKGDRFPAVDRPRVAKHKILPARASKKEES